MDLNNYYGYNVTSYVAIIMAGTYSKYICFSIKLSVQCKLLTGKYQYGTISKMLYISSIQVFLSMQLQLSPFSQTLLDIVSYPNLSQVPYSTYSCISLYIAMMI